MYSTAVKNKNHELYATARSKLSKSIVSKSAKNDRSSDLHDLNTDPLKHNSKKFLDFLNV